MTSVYRFDRLEVVPFETWSGPRQLVVRAGDREGPLRGSPRAPVAATPRVHVWVEGPIGRAVFGVRTYGVSPTGVEEWYRSVAWRPLRHVSATIGGMDVGSPGPIDPPTRFGFSEPPRHPSM